MNIKTEIMVNKKYKSHSPPGIVVGTLRGAPVATGCISPHGPGCCDLNNTEQIPPGVLQTFYYKPRNGITTGPPVIGQPGGMYAVYNFKTDPITYGSQPAKGLLNGWIFPGGLLPARAVEIVPASIILTHIN